MNSAPTIPISSPPRGIRFDVFELDGTRGTIDLTVFAETLLRDGLNLGDAADAGSTVVLGEIRCDDEVVFLVDGIELDHDVAMRCMGGALVGALTASLKSYGDVSVPE